MKNSKGQAVIEYVLLLLLVVSLATIITLAFASRQQGNEGFLMTYWKGIITAIGADDAQRVNPEE